VLPFLLLLLLLLFVECKELFSDSMEEVVLSSAVNVSVVMSLGSQEIVNVVVFSR
jgi:hypothetical protein